MEMWGRFHCHLKDLASWLTEAETKLQDSKNANGKLDMELAKTYQKVSIMINMRLFVNAARTVLSSGDFAKVHVRFGPRVWLKKFLTIQNSSILLAA